MFSLNDKINERFPLTFILPVYNEEKNIDYLFEQFIAFWHNYNCNLIFVNDGSTDATLDILRRKKESFPRLQIINLSRNFGKDQALCAGLSVVQPNQYVITMDADGQHTLSATKKILEFQINNPDIDIVFGTRSNRNYQGSVSRSFTNLLYKMLNINSSRYTIRSDVGDFFIATPRVIDEFKKYYSNRPFWKGYYGYVGFNQAYVQVDIEERYEGNTKFKIKQQLSLAADSLVAYVKWPLRLIFLSGLLISLISALFLFYIIGNYLVTKQTANGFYTIVVLQLMFGGFTLICLGVMSEYIGMIYDNVSAKQPFIIRNIE